MVLFAAAILTESLLRNEIPQLVWDPAIAAGCGAMTGQIGSGYWTMKRRKGSGCQ